MKLSTKISNIPESGTLRFTKIVQDLRNEGKEIIDFTAGEPDLPTPEEAITASKKALDAHMTKYSVVSGMSALKNKLAEHHKTKPINIVITNGGKQAIFNTLQVICNPKDEVIINKPYWTTFPESVKLADAIPIITETNNHQLDLEKIKNNITKQTKALIINSPCNPTGAVIPKKDLKAIADLANDHNFFIISDEVYDSITYNTKFESISQFAKEKTIVIKSFSKNYSMTGLRVGYLIANQEIIKPMNRFQGHISGNVNNIAQIGALAALSTNKSFLEKRKQEFETRRNLTLQLTKKHFECVKPEGAFYVFPNVKTDSNKLSEKLLTQANVATVPGDAFGQPNHLRISYATSQENIKKGFENISKAI